ncbi:phosphopantetheine-binding protein [Micromonospora sp. NPDC093244]|uniref:phosphopantetheine-binding protein n=1 Tax=Micromonospora sp. NPDC093244 TaxID=3155071 RepID=UPI003425564A
MEQGAEAIDINSVEDLQDRIGAIWRSVLGTSDFGYDDDFFAVGGDSFKMLMVRAEIEETIDGCEVAIVELLRFPTVASLASQLHQRLASNR